MPQYADVIEVIVQFSLIFDICYTLLICTKHIQYIHFINMITKAAQQYTDSVNQILSFSIYNLIEIDKYRIPKESPTRQN
jgi:hypothetical protein